MRTLAIATLLFLVALVAACDTLPFIGTPPTPTATATPVPTATPIPPTATPTLLPTITPLPPTPTFTSTPAPSQTPLPTNTATLTPTRTRLPVAATPTPTRVSPPTTVALRFKAPELIEPGPRASYEIGKSDLVLKWAPVGGLAPNECYLVDVAVVNAIDSREGELTYTTLCGNPGGTASVSFTLVKRPPGNDYKGLVDKASRDTPSNEFRVRWTVTVIQQLGGDKFVPISPASAPLTFTLREPQ